MKKIYSVKKSAFSLIELSIVLIIIGLLIAGITGGASLIKNSELRSIAGEARGYQVAVNGFYSLYDELPGDLAKAVSGSTIFAGPATGNGENGKIEYFAADVAGTVCNTSASSSTAVVCNSESIAAWNQLIRTGVIDSTTVITYLTIGQSQVPGTNMPAAKIKYAGWHFDYRNRVGAAGDYSAESPSTTVPTIAEAGIHSPQNVIVLTAATVGSTAASATLVNGTSNTSIASLTGSEALSIDTKVDDGVANTGKVRGLNQAALTTCYVPSATADAQYVITSATDRVCSLTFQVDPKSS